MAAMPPTAPHMARKAGVDEAAFPRRWFIYSTMPALPDPSARPLAARQCRTPAPPVATSNGTRRRITPNELATGQHCWYVGVGICGPGTPARLRTAGEQTGGRRGELGLRDAG